MAGLGAIINITADYARMCALFPDTHNIKPSQQKGDCMPVASWTHGTMSWIWPCHTDTHTLMWTIPGKEYSYGSESRFAQAVCTGIAPDYSHSRCDWKQKGKIRNILWKKKAQIRWTNCHREKGQTLLSWVSNRKCLHNRVKKQE